MASDGRYIPNGDGSVDEPHFIDSNGYCKCKGCRDEFFKTLTRDDQCEIPYIPIVNDSNPGMLGSHLNGRSYYDKPQFPRHSVHSEWGTYPSTTVPYSDSYSKGPDGYGNPTSYQGYNGPQMSINAYHQPTSTEQNGYCSAPNYSSYQNGSYGTSQSLLPYHSEVPSTAQTYDRFQPHFDQYRTPTTTYTPAYNPIHNHPSYQPRLPPISLPTSDETSQSTTPNSSDNNSGSNSDSKPSRSTRNKSKRPVGRPSSGRSPSETRRINNETKNRSYHKKRNETKEYVLQLDAKIEALESRKAELLTKKKELSLETEMLSLKLSN